MQNAWWGFPLLILLKVYSLANNHTSLLEQSLHKKSVPLAQGRCETTTDMAAFSLFWITNMAAVTSCKNDLLHSKVAEQFENCWKKLGSSPMEMNPNETILRIVKFPN